MKPDKPRKPNRLDGYDYSLDGYYFITICIHEYADVLGVVKNGRMHISKNGKIVQDIWQQIPRHFSNVNLDEFIIMPNHVHGIVVINKQNKTKQSLSVIVGSFKSAVTKEINNAQFKWQRSFHDHIIRTPDSLQRIRQYIKNNPANWHEDENNKLNIRNHKIICRNIGPGMPGPYDGLNHL